MRETASPASVYRKHLFPTAFGDDFSHIPKPGHCKLRVLLFFFVLKRGKSRMRPAVPTLYIDTPAAFGFNIRTVLMTNRTNSQIFHSDTSFSLRGIRRCINRKPVYDAFHLSTPRLPVSDSLPRYLY